MDRYCKICKVNRINHLHGNAETCIPCRTKRIKPEVKPMEQNVTMSYETYVKLKELSDKYKALELASINHYPVCFNGTWKVRVNKMNVDLMEWYRREHES